MGERPCVDDQSVEAADGPLDGVDDGAFVIRLKRLQGCSVRRGASTPLSLEVCKSGCAIDMRFSGSEKVEIWAIDDEDAHLVSLNGLAFSCKYERIVFRLKSVCECHRFGVNIDPLRLPAPGELQGERG